MSKAESNTSLLSNTSFLFFNRFFVNIAGILIMYFFSHKLSEAHYGQYQVFWAQLNIFNALAGIGFSAFAIIYAPERIIALFKSIKKLKYFQFVVYIGIVLFIFGLIQLKNNTYILYSMVFLLFFVINNIIDTLFVVFRKFKTLLLLSFIYSLLFFLIHYFAINEQFSLNRLVFSLIFLLACKIGIGLAVILPHFFKGTIVHLDSFSFSNMMSLWRHLFYFDVIQISSLWLDKFIISLLFSQEQTAIYINGTLNIPFIPIIFTALTSSALIQLSSKNNREFLLKTVNNVGKLLSSIAFPVCIFFLFFSREFIILFFSDKYLESIPIFICSILILPARAYGSTIILQHKEKGKIINTGAILDILVALSLMYPLYLLFGLPGVALSFVLSTFIQIGYYLIKTKNLLKVRLSELMPITNWLAKAVLFILICWGLWFFIPQSLTDFHRLLLAALVMGVSALTVLFFEFRSIKRL